MRCRPPSGSPRLGWNYGARSRPHPSNPRHRSPKTPPSEEREGGWNDRQLTEKFRFDESWDSPANRKLHDMRPLLNFSCPSHPVGAEKGLTSFVAVVGP